MKSTFQGPLIDTVVSVINPSVATPGTAVPVFSAGSVVIGSVITVDTNAAGTFAASSLAANAVTITGHGYKTGLVGQLTTAGGLPTGLSTSTNYYIIVVDVNTVKFATTYAHAVAGTVISLSGGSGNSTFTPTALAGASVQPQWSVDALNWFNDGSSTNITTAVNYGFKKDRPEPYYYRLSYSISSGSLTLSSTSIVNKDIP